MSATVLQIVTRALRMLRVIDPNETCPADKFENALVTLNSMMARIEASGVSVGWQPVTDAAEAIPVPPECEEWVAAGLACRMAPEYAKGIDPVTLKMYESGLKATERDVLTAAPLTLDSSLPISSTGRRWNILNDSWNSW